MKIMIIMWCVLIPLQITFGILQIVLDSYMFMLLFTHTTVFTFGTSLTGFILSYEISKTKEVK